MNLEKSMDELERHINSSQSYFDDVRVQIERELKDVNEEIADLKDTIKELEEDADTADTQIQELMYQNSMLQLELTEVTNELITLRNEIMKKDGIIIHLKHELVTLGENIFGK